MSENTFLQARIAATEAEIVLYESAATALASGVLSYTIDSGQNRQTVTRQDSKRVQDTINVLYNRRNALLSRLNGGGGISVPGW